MNGLKYVFAVSTASILTACTPPKVPETTGAPTPPASSITSTPSEKITTSETTSVTSTVAVKKTGVPSSFELSGAIAAKSNKKGWTATLNWVQSSTGHYQMRLIGPLGGQTIIIEKNNGVVTYHEGKKKLSSSNGDDLLAKETGIHLPVNNLYYWVRGISAPGAVQSTARDAEGHLTMLKQAGYTIDYSGYMSAGSYSLPAKIRLQGRGVMIKLVVKHWNVA